MMYFKLLLFVVGVCLAQKQKENLRKPKLFFVSTASTTSTFITQSTCYQTAASLTTCPAKRRKRTIVDDEIDLSSDFSPSRFDIIDSFSTFENLFIFRVSDDMDEDPENVDISSSSELDKDLGKYEKH